MLGKVLASCALLGLPVSALATGIEFRAGEAVMVPADEVIAGDLYASGETVTIAGVVLGDVVAAGREVKLIGRAEGDLIAAGQVIVIDGAVGDDVRFAGSVLRLGSEASVADHVVSAGYSFEAEPGSRIGGDLVVSAAKAKLAGNAESDVRVTASALEIGGSIGGNVEAKVSGELGEASWFESFLPATVPVSQVADGFTVADSAWIGGQLSYSSPSEAEIPAGAAGGGVDWNPVEATAEDPPPTLLSQVWSAVRRFGALLIVGLLLLWRAPSWFEARSDQLAKKPLPTVGWGVAGLVGTPAAMLLVLGATILLAVLAGNLALGRLSLLIVLLGLTLFIVLLVGFLVAILFGAPLLVSSTGGRLLLERADPARSRRAILALVLGLVILTVLTNLPVVGWVIGLLAVIAGLGPLTRWLTTLRRKPIAE